ncbi:MAG: hypothetical protein NTV68_16750 [Methanomicrobiales archaeon]|nr:hypothetical protein [Methanomicrobiales archaeon]
MNTKNPSPSSSQRKKSVCGFLEAVPGNSSYERLMQENPSIKKDGKNRGAQYFFSDTPT